MKFSGLNLSIVGVAILGFALGANAQNAIGQVSSAKGSVSAQGPNGSRALSCGDSVFAGETLVTGVGSSVGVLMGDVLAQVSADSALQVAHTDAGAPDATLERGRVRMIDVREDGGAPGRLVAGDASSVLAGNDTEAYLLSEKVGEYAMFCEWDAPLAVARNGKNKNADAGNCVIAKPAEPLYTAKAHEQRIAASGADYCPPSLGGLASTGPHFSPLTSRGVSADGGPLLWSGLADPTSIAEILPCDDPGQLCGAGGGTPGIVTVSAPPPMTGPQPGSGGTFPGTGTTPDN